MFPSIRLSRISGSAVCLSALSVAVLAVAGFAPQVSAQSTVPPQLLPNTSQLVAGGGATAATVGATCQRAVYPATNPVTYTSSGYTATDTFGDGCLATEITLVTPRFVVTDSTGAVYFSDYTNGLIRRVDPVTGIVSVVAGGGTTVAGTVATPVACGAYKSIDGNGDGCLSTAMKLGHPTGLVFDSSGDLYFADYGYSVVREIKATGGLITTGGVVTNIAGQASGTYGYNVTNTSTTPPVIAATQGILNDPYGLALDSKGNLYIADEDNQALEIVNLTANSETMLGITLAPGSIWKVVGYGNAAMSAVTTGVTSPKVTASATSGDCPDFGSAAYFPTYRGGCAYGTYTENTPGTTSNVDGLYSVAVDTSGNIYFPDEYDNVLTKENAGTTNISTYAGLIPLSGTSVKQTNTSVRGLSTAVGMGSGFGIAIDPNNNIYSTDAFNGLIWRIDATTQTMYVIGGGATATGCGTVDVYGDGCIATDATFGKSGSSYASTTTIGVLGISVDSYGDLFTADTVSNLIREVSNGTQFGNTGAVQTDYLVVHFAPGDGPAATNPYTITSGSSIFTVTQGSCTVNADNNGTANTQDCNIAITAAPTASGPYTGVLQVASVKDPAGATFTLNGNFVQSPETRLSLTTSSATASSCSGSTIYSTTAPVVLKGTLTANGPSAPTGTITFYSGATQLGSPVNVTNLGTTTAPVYGAVLNNTFSTAGTYSVTARYVPVSGSYYDASSSTPASLSTSAPTFTTAPVSYSENTVSPGATALYSFTLAASVYTGTVNFSCSGLPANSTCSFSPASITGVGCSTSSTIALSIQTQAGTTVQTAGLDGAGGLWSMMAVFFGIFMATLLGIFRRRIPLRTGQLLLVVALLLAATGLTACGKAAGTQLTPATPAFSGNITVTATGSDSTVSTFTVPLKVL